MCKFHIGQKVVCIDAKNGDWLNRPKFNGQPDPDWHLVEGEIYTVSSYNNIIEGEWCIHLEEIPERIPRDECSDFDAGYHQDRFRPLKETNIDIFLEMLNPNDETIKKFQEEEEHV